MEGDDETTNVLNSPEKNRITILQQVSITLDCKLIAR